MSTCSAVRLALFLVTMFLAAEKRHSDGVDVAGTDKYDFARMAKVGNLASFSFHHLSRFSSFGIGSSPEYISISFLTISLFI